MKKAKPEQSAKIRADQAGDAKLPVHRNAFGAEKQTIGIVDGERWIWGEWRRRKE